MTLVPKQKLISAEAFFAAAEANGTHVVIVPVRDPRTGALLLVTGEPPDGQTFMVTGNVLVHEPREGK